MTDRQIALLAASLKILYAGLKGCFEPTAKQVIEDAEKYYEFLNKGRYNG